MGGFRDKLCITQDSKSFFTDKREELAMWNSDKLGKGFSAKSSFPDKNACSIVRFKANRTQT